MRKMVAGATVAATVTMVFNAKATAAVYRIPLHTLETPTTIYCHYDSTRLWRPRVWCLFAIIIVIDANCLIAASTIETLEDNRERTLDPPSHRAPSQQRNIIAFGNCRAPLMHGPSVAECAIVRFFGILNSLTHISIHFDQSSNENWWDFFVILAAGELFYFFPFTWLRAREQTHGMNRVNRQYGVQPPLS